MNNGQLPYFQSLSGVGGISTGRRYTVDLQHVTDPMECLNAGTMLKKTKRHLHVKL